jgi:mono/diheme cytochrome c family protein
LRKGVKKNDLLYSVAVTGVSLLLCLAFAPSRWRAQGAQSPPESDRTVQAFFARTCYACHNAELRSGGMNLETLQTGSGITQNRETWDRVLRKLRAGEMPPKGVPRPNPEELKTVISWIEGEFLRADRVVKPDPARVTMRRLNRAEYNNTVRDLLGVHLRPADNFPQDDSGYGFDNIGDVLSLSPVLMENYVTAAERVARAAVFGPEQMKPIMVKLRPPGRHITPTLTPLFDYDTTGLTLPNAIHITHTFPVDGEYILRVFLGGSRPIGSEPFFTTLWIDGHQVESIELDPTKTAAFDVVEKQDLGGKVQEFRTKVAAGGHWVAASIQRLYEGLPARYRGPNPSKHPVASPQFNPKENPSPANLARARKRFDASVAASENAPVNDARLISFEIGGPYNQAKGPAAESLKKIYTCGHLNGHHLARCAHEIVAGLARRAFRRPVAQKEIDKLVSFVSLAQKHGDSFEEGICQSLQAMLVSPYFLFRIEQSRASAASDDSNVISDHELASRLSYFLWSSMPDDELMRLADRHALRRREVLDGQIRRMLKDPRSHALVENFGGQWLELRKLESVKPDRQRFPDFDEYLRISMRRETELFFESIVREDRSILDFIDADYTFLNERLANLYKIPGVKGTEFRKVVFAGGTQRGGVLTQASILTVSSYATRTSPVLRGKWILEKILNAPPPPPPPGVPNLDESKIGSAASLREQLEAHRQNATCASCHARMDPLGFGLENFDAIGAWRTEDGKFPIDASGMLPDGRSFKGPAELRTILRQDRSGFAEGVTEKLLIYALGRGLESYDQPAVKRIVNQLDAANYRFSTLVFEIAASKPFQMRRGDRAL